MSRTQWLVSVLLVLHVSALFLGSIPPPRGLPEVAPPRYPTDDVVAARATPILDQTAAGVSRLATAIWRGLAPIPRIARLYLRSMGLGQQWIMFWRPPRQDEYLRLRYYVGQQQGDGGTARPAWAATELVFPIEREDRARLMSGYWNKTYDKALFTAIGDFLDHRDDKTIRPDLRPEQLPRDLVPVVRYFAGRFHRDHLAPGERILRTEVWYGGAPVPPRGKPEDQVVLLTRLAALRRYYDGPVEDRWLREYPPYFASEQEGDILWVLEYFEES